VAAKRSSSQDTKPRSKGIGPTGLPLCAVCGEREVPREEWPADPLFPKVCDPCLRQHAWAPVRAPQAAAPPEPRQTAPEPQAAAEAVPGEFPADFG
jgi:hypothetical protein